MAGLISAARFVENVRRICNASKAVARVESYGETPRVARIRVFLINFTFVDIYYNQKTGTTTFAQIRRDQRIFGADNKNGWHWHPREDPSQHLESNDEITFEKFFREVEKHIK